MYHRRLGGAPRGIATNRIFISYRREDTSGYAGRLNDRLRDRFGHDQVFMDIDAIEPGLDYQELIEGTIGSIDVLVALMGREWLTTPGPTGSRRLDDPDDFVRLEIAGALDRNVRVIPVLVEAAAMPTIHDLPEPLAPLARRNAIELSDSRWDYDCERLVSVLHRALGRAAPAAAPAPAEPVRRRWAPGALTGIVVAATVAVLVWGVLAPRNWHSEWPGLRLASEGMLVAMVIAGLWRKQWTWVVAGSGVGLVGLVVWAQFLLSGGHTTSDLFGSGDGAANVIAFVASAVVLGTGLVGIRREREALIT
ncbi:MAG: toll/interleukin-1 receptor domain-containing protein [Acidimicrobiales bacterium]